MAGLLTAIKAALEVDSTEDAALVASKVMRGKSRDVRDAWLMELLTEEVKHAQRDMSRQRESADFAALFNSRPSSSTNAPLGKFGALLTSPFAVGNGRRVSWGEATVADHLERIAFLEHMRKGITQTIDRHRVAIEQIEAAGVSCLAELARPPLWASSAAS